MSVWSQRITLHRNTTTCTDRDELLLSHRGEWMGEVTIAIGRVDGITHEKKLKVGGYVEYGPYAFGNFEIRLMEITDSNTAQFLVTRLS